MISIRALLSISILIAAFTSLAAAQQASPVPSSFVLEVRFYPPQAPAYQTVSVRRGGAWYARFGHVPEWRQPPDVPAVTAVNILSELAEDAVRVWVSVFLGPTHAQEKAVKSYILREGEKVIVSELAQVGVEPFEIKLVKLAPIVGNAPTFVSKARSIELVVMEANISTLPSYKVVVRNISAKTVSALRMQTIVGGRPQISSMPQGKEGLAIIVPGATYELDARLATRTTPTPDGYSPVILPNQVIEISTAVFDDASFEGDSEGAIVFAAYRKGRKIMLGRVLDLLQKSLTTNDSATATSADWLKSEVAALKLEADSAAAEEVQNKFAVVPGFDLNRLQTVIEASMKGVKDQVLSDITQFQLRNRRADQNGIHDWLTASRERYEAWLARL